MTDHQKKNWKSYCSEQLELIENYMAAKADDFEGWCIHHRLEIQPDGTHMSRQELKDKDLYYGRPASELIFMRRPEHKRLHWLGKHHSAEARKKMSESHKGKHLPAEHRKKLSESLSGEKNPFFGKHHSADTRRKMSESLSGENHPLFGKHRSAETRQKISESHKGKKLGVHWWNNGISIKLAKECPGPEWKRGRI